MKKTIVSYLKNVRATSPLVHNITNFVVMNNTANALLAVGASPVMAHAQEEVADMVSIASALVINIGTLSPAWVEAMKIAMKQAYDLEKPIILDPVGAGATPYRNESLLELLSMAAPTVIRGNASEIMALVASERKTKGVDSTDSSQSAIESAKTLNKTYGSIVCISGAEDIILDHEREVRLSNGHPLMAKVTGMGCTATALIGAFCGANEHSFEATVSAMAVLGIAGEIAAQSSQGPGSLQLHILDQLHLIEEQVIDQQLRLNA